MKWALYTYIMGKNQLNFLCFFRRFRLSHFNDIVWEKRQKSGYLVEFIIRGHSGHALQLFENTPGEKLNKLLTKMYEFRTEEMRKLNELKYPYGNVTSINLTILKGGVQPNLIPAEFSATFDMRVSVNADLNEFEKQVLPTAIDVYAH